MVPAIIEKYKKAFVTLKQGVTKYGPAPHKPVLLLSVLQAILSNQISDHRIYVTPELIFLFKSNWNRMVKTPHVSTFALPFFHLHKEKSAFWKLIPRPGFEAILSMKESVSSLSELNNMIFCAVIPDELFFLLKDEASNITLQNCIVERYFPDVVNGIQYPISTGLHQLSEIVLNETPERYRQEIQTLIKQKDEDEIFLRGSLFKREIPRIYNNTCCISGMRIDATIHISMIDACHIVPFSESFNDTVTNGIALCPNLHRAFDRGLIGIDDQFRVVLSKAFREDKTSYSIGDFNRIQIKLPVEKKFYPSKENLGWHRKNVFK